MTSRIAVFLFMAAGGCAEAPVAVPAVSTAAPSAAPSLPAEPEIMKTDAQISNTLVDLLEGKDRIRTDLANVQGTPLGEILTIGSPIGYALRNRYLNIGVPIAEALSRNADPVFREKLVTMARWDKGEVRAAALVALAGTQDLKYFDIYREALVHLDPAVRFGALEGLFIWGNPEKSLPLLKAATERESEPILRVYAAGVLAKLGEEAGLIKLRSLLDDGSWLVRAMAGRFLGDYGKVEDYESLRTRIGREQTNDFVLAEYCIAALKLFGRKSQ